MALTGMNHFNIVTDDVPGTLAFYRDVLGLREGYRPDLGFPGAWLYIGEQPVLHISGVSSRDALRPGVIDHMAFSATGLDATLERLRANAVEFTLRQQAGTRLWQIFVRDPNGARVELDFDAGERAA